MTVTKEQVLESAVTGLLRGMTRQEADAHLRALSTEDYPDFDFEAAIATDEDVAAQDAEERALQARIDAANRTKRLADLRAQAEAAEAANAPVEPAPTEPESLVEPQVPVEPQTGGGNL